jgi:hypothetical protein
VTLARIMAVAALIVGAFVGGAVAASTVWRTFATGTDSGQYGAFANASGNVTRPRGLAVKVTLRGASTADVNYDYSCSGMIKLGSGRLYVLSLANAQKCFASGSASTSGGSATIQLLKAR